jgi:ABC-type bacteriocin/lantibiotic exporter with double-glycine peptidase domain
MSFIGACLETIGVSVLLPYISLLSEADYTIPEKFAFLFPESVTRSRTGFLAYVSLVVLMIYLLKNIYIYALGVIKRKYILTEWNRTTCKVLDNYLSRPYLYFLATNVNDISNRINNYTTKAYLLLGIFISILSEVMQLCLLLVFLLFLDVKLTVAFGCVFLLFVIISRKIVSRKIYNVGRESNEVYADMLKTVMEAVYGILDIKLLQREPVICDNYEKLARRNMEAEVKKTKLTTAPKYILEVVSVTVLLILVWLSAGNGGEGISVAVLSTASVALIRIMPSVSRLNGYIGEMNYYLPAMNDICDDMFIRGQKTQTDAKLSFDKEITFEHIYFSYNGDVPVLTDVNLKISKGSRVGIRGASGGGKSTLANIMLGMLEPDSGCVRSDGTDIRENLSVWYSLISYIPQDIFLIDGSIQDNVVFMREVDEDKLWQVLEKVKLKDFVDGMKDGIKTRVGDRGIKLSGGQRQRLGIARALYNDAKIFIFDEPTSALDIELEAEVMDSIYSLDDKTVIIIAHRLETLEKCDAIYEVKGNNVRQVR